MRESLYFIIIVWLLIFIGCHSKLHITVNDRTYRIGVDVQ